MIYIYIYICFLQKHRVKFDTWPRFSAHSSRAICEWGFAISAGKPRVLEPTLGASAAQHRSTCWKSSARAGAQAI